MSMVCVFVCVCGRITDGQRACENSSSVAEAGVPMTARLFSSVPCGTSPPFSPLSLRSLIGHKWFPSRGPLSWLISSDDERDSGVVSAKRCRFLRRGSVSRHFWGRRNPPCPAVSKCQLLSSFTPTPRGNKHRLVYFLISATRAAVPQCDICVNLRGEEPGLRARRYLISLFLFHWRRAQHAKEPHKEPTQPN